MALVPFEKCAPASELLWDDEHELAWVVHSGDTHGEDDACSSMDATRRLIRAHGLKKVRIVVDMRQVRSVSREARAAYADPDNTSILVAVAAVVWLWVVPMV